MKNNAPVFPIINNNQVFETGMTLRDFFANSAMNAYISASTDLINHGFEIDAHNIAKECYLIADAMLVQRNVPETDR